MSVERVFRLSKESEKPHHRGARKIRDLLVRRLAGGARVPAKSTIHAVLDRHGLVKHIGRAAIALPERRCRSALHPTSCGAPTSRASWCRKRDSNPRPRHYE
jgi:hypothetical protein